MKNLRALFHRLRGLFPNRESEHELSAELESHLALHIDDNIRAGMSPAEARRDALLKLGGVAQTKEAYRDRRTVPALENRLLDLRFAARQMRRSPGFSVTAILLLSLGICGSVAIFAFVDAALLKPLPYRDPDRLIGVYESVPSFRRSNLSYLDYLDWKEQSTVFESLDVYNRSGYMLQTPGGVEVARASRVSAGFFRTLGVSPILGRDFREGEDLPGSPRITILSYATWQRRYAGSRDAIGQSVIFDGEPFQIIGVLPRDFHFAPAEPVEFWTSQLGESSCEKRRSCHNLYGVARLKDGETIDSALAQLTTIAERLEAQYPDSNRDQGAAVAPLAEVIVGDIRDILLVLLCGALLLLLIGTVNVASLLLVRSESRSREFAVRNALGASSGRIFSQFMTEGVLLVAIGTAIGLGLAAGAVRLLPSLVPQDIYAAMPYLHHIGPNIRIAAFAGAVVLLAVALFSLTPVLRLSLSRLRDDLAEGGRGSADRSWRRLGSRLVVVELAMAIVLLVSAALLGQSLYRLLKVDPGLDADHLAAISMGAPRAEFDTDAKLIALEREVIRLVKEIPGVTHAGIADQLPVTHNGNTTWFRIAGRPHNGEHLESPERAVGSTYFQTVGARLVRGRFFHESEDASAAPVAIVNQSMARRHFPGEDPVGKFLTDLASPPHLTRIVGLVEDVKEGAMDTETPPVIYVPFNQSTDSHFVVFVRTAVEPESILDDLRQAVLSAAPNIVTLPPVTLEKHIHNSQAVYLNRSSAILVGIFAAVAFLLSVVGLYGVIAYSVSRRNREIGVRIALGAQRANVYRLVLREAVLLAIAGIAIGVIGSLTVTGFLRGMLFDVESWDPPTLAAVAVIVSVAALLASFLPARRAASLNPVDALRTE